MPKSRVRKSYRDRRRRELTLIQALRTQRNALRGFVRHEITRRERIAAETGEPAVVHVPAAAAASFAEPVGVTDVVAVTRKPSAGDSVEHAPTRHDLTVTILPDDEPQNAD